CRNEIQDADGAEGVAASEPVGRPGSKYRPEHGAVECRGHGQSMHARA
ncbi:MAG: hypothetical protein RI897_3006, partial [Verrucomicrobiota bacterium]